MTIPGLPNVSSDSPTSAGANVVINGLAEQHEIDFVCGELDKACPVSRIVYNGANLMNPTEATGLIEETIVEFGGIDILVNNAGIQHVSPIETFPPEKYEAIIALNLKSALFLAQQVAKHQIAQGDCRLVVAEHLGVEWRVWRGHGAAL